MPPRPPHPGRCCRRCPLLGPCVPSTPTRTTAVPAACSLTAAACGGRGASACGGWRRICEGCPRRRPGSAVVARPPPPPTLPWWRTTPACACACSCSSSGALAAWARWLRLPWPPQAAAVPAPAAGRTKLPAPGGRRGPGDATRAVVPAVRTRAMRGLARCTGSGPWRGPGTWLRPSWTRGPLPAPSIVRWPQWWRLPVCT